MTHPDLEPAVSAIARLTIDLPDAVLGSPTSCPDYTVGGVVAHVHGLAQAFAAAGRKDLGPLTTVAPDPTQVLLPENWRETINVHLDGLAEAWRDPNAWVGQTQVGGVDLPAEAAGMFALDEIVIHGWDIAHATGHHFDPGGPAVATVHAFLTQLRQGEVDPSLFGPAVDVPADRSLLDRAAGLAGRDPSVDPATAHPPL